MPVLVHSEKEDVALELLSKARRLWSDDTLGVVPLIEGKGDASKYFDFGADMVYAVSPLPSSASQCARVLHEIIDSQGFDLVLTGSTRKGKEISPMASRFLRIDTLLRAIPSQPSLSYLSEV
jgi:electron transfer flavoprotein alpha subunit